jgi:hypothetical protein
VPVQVVGIIEASPFLSRGGWGALAEPVCEWNGPSVEEVDADFEQLAADLADEWARLRLRLGQH